MIRCLGVQEYIVKHEPDCEAIVYNTLLELYLRDYDLVPSTFLEEEESVDSAPRGSEGVMAQSGADYEAAHVVAKEKNHEAALMLLRNPGSKYDDDHALCLVQVSPAGASVCVRAAVGWHASCFHDE